MIPADLLALLFTHARQTPMKRQQFRGDVPAISPAPDRARWEADHGTSPYPLTLERFNGLTLQRFRFARFTNRARKCIERDLATIDRDKAIRESVKLEHICERVKTAFDIIHAQVFFDPSDGQFWIYPHGWARHEPRAGDCEHGIHISQCRVCDTK